MFLPLMKVDAVQRVFVAQIDETPDRTGEVFDYATSKPEFVAWSGEIAKATEGKSLGNVRVMHSLAAVGVLADIQYDDIRKSITFTGRVLDDDTWRKVEAGLYTGISPGGKYLKTWADGAHKRYTARPTEISLVDLPCIPTAHFTLVKAAGVEEQRSFAPPSLTAEIVAALEGADEMAKAAALAALAKAAYSAEDREAMAKSGEAMKDGSYPIKTADDLAAAISAYGRADDKPEAKAHIVKRAEALQATDKLPEAWGYKKAAAAADLKKYLGEQVWDANTALEALSRLYVLLGNERSETEVAPDQIAALKDAIQRIKDFIAAEIQESDLTMQAAAKTGDLAKATQATLTKVATLEGELAKVAAERDGFAKRIADLEKQPAPGGARLKSLDKAADHGASATEGAPEAGDDFATALAKVNAMPPGAERRDALNKLALSNRSTSK